MRSHQAILELGENTTNGNAWEHSPENAFALWLSDARHGYGRPYNEGSAKVYMAMWAVFARHMKSIGETPISVSPAIVSSFLGSQSSNPRTQRRYAGLLSKVFRNLRQQGLREDNPMREVFLRMAPSDRRPLPVVLSRKQEQAFLSLLPDSENWRRQRDYALMRLILGAGLRLSEALELKMDDLYMADAPPFVQVAARGPYRERVVPIAPMAQEFMRMWLSQRAYLDIPGNLVFPGNMQGDQISAATVYRQIKAAMEQAGIQKTHQGAQVLRDTFCVRQLAAGKSLGLVQRWMGHEKEETTERFLQLIATPGGESAV